MITIIVVVAVVVVVVVVVTGNKTTLPLINNNYQDSNHVVMSQNVHIEFSGTSVMLDSMPSFRFKYWIRDNSNHVNKQAPTCTGCFPSEKQAVDQHQFQPFHGPDGSPFEAISAG